MIWQMLANVLKALPGEASHKVTVAALSKGIYPRYSPIQLPTEIGALRFPNPIGLAAGLIRMERLFPDVLRSVLEAWK